MTKEKAIEIIHKSAQQFERNLRGKQIMFVAGFDVLFVDHMAYMPYNSKEVT